MEFKDYYKLLGVDKKATADEIKKAYRQLARKHHPDANKGDKDAENRFKEIQEAYAVLSDPEKRSKYDNLGSSWSNFRQSGGSETDFNWSDWFQQGNTGRKRQKAGDYSNLGDMLNQGGNLSDFFEQIFGGGFGTGKKKQQAQKGADYQSNVEISLEEAFHGASRLITVNEQKIEVKFKPGIPDEHVMKISGKGSPGRQGGAGGDLIIKVTIRTHPKYERKGDDLHMEHTVDLYKAILGGTERITTLGGVIKMTIPAESQPGKIMKLKGLGMPKYTNPAEKGDLFVKLNVKLPENLSDHEKELFEELKGLRKEVM